jgi:hypothetical protein
MLSTLDQNMDRAIQFFVQQAEKAQHEADRRLYEHLQSMAAGVQENRRMLDFLQTRLDALDHEVKSH